MDSSIHPKKNYSLDLLQGSVSPEGRRAAAVNPEVCSLASSIYECQYKGTSSSVNLQEDAKTSTEDQVSLASYHSEHSRSYSYGQIRPMQLYHPQGKTGVQDGPNSFPSNAICQQKVKLDQQNLKITESSGKYASLNAANLCELGANYYESRCCQGNPRGKQLNKIKW